jgi:hypothetical protein
MDSGGIQIWDWAQAHGDVPRFRSLTVEVTPLLLQGWDYGGESYNISVEEAIA